MKQILTTLLATALLANLSQAQPTLTVLTSFTGTNGANPQASLTLASDGNFWGTTSGGGTNKAGTVFKVSTNGVVSNVYSFAGTNGAVAYAPLTLASDGAFYGTTYFGSSTLVGGNPSVSGFGTVFRMVANGVNFNNPVKVADFGSTNGNFPRSGLTPGPPGIDNNLYGTTSSGGTNDSQGTVFKVTPNGAATTMTMIYSFKGGTNGGKPFAGLTRVPAQGVFFGTTSQGGNTNLNNGSGYGIAFKITSGGTFTKLADFNGTNGANCAANLVLAGDGNLYGITSMGGTNGAGNIFRLTTGGVLTSLYSFTGGNDGRNPYGLTYANDGYFYGTTYLSGPGNQGTVFRFATNGVLTTLHSFTNSLSFSNGGNPSAGLTLGSDGNFYGTTTFGSAISATANNNGTVFKLVVPPAMNSISASNRVPKITVTGLTRPMVQIQATTNLLSPWSALTNLILTTGTNQFTDPSATNSPQKFYRAAVQ